MATKGKQKGQDRRGKGPDGEGTLCLGCAARYRQGKTSAIPKDWACAWCKIERTGKKRMWVLDHCSYTLSKFELIARCIYAGPAGEETLCQACNKMFKDGLLEPPAEDWKCEWCKCDRSQTTGLQSGPSGAATLCLKCGQSYRRSGESGVRKQIADGNDIPDACSLCGKKKTAFAAIHTFMRHLKECTNHGACRAIKPPSKRSQS